MIWQSFALLEGGVIGGDDNVISHYFPERDRTRPAFQTTCGSSWLACHRALCVCILIGPETTLPGKP